MTLRIYTRRFLLDTGSLSNKWILMSIENLLDSLENQRAAATFSGTHALVLAGAGTGKTRSIVARAGYLIH